MRLAPFVLFVVVSISSSFGAETQKCMLRKRILPAASNGQRLLPHEVTPFHNVPGVALS